MLFSDVSCKFQIWERVKIQYLSLYNFFFSTNSHGTPVKKGWVRESYEKYRFLVKTYRTWGILEPGLRDMGVSGESLENSHLEHVSGILEWLERTCRA
jgi:hypothetical protein